MRRMNRIKHPYIIRLETTRTSKYPFFIKPLSFEKFEVSWKENLDSPWSRKRFSSEKSAKKFIKEKFIQRESGHTEEVFNKKMKSKRLRKMM
jgi:hypothetical protein